MGWIVVRNWDRFQHYGSRQPPWIKMYVALLHDDDFQSLSPADRSALISLWMLYAMTRRRVRDDTAKLSRALGQRVTKRTLDSLNHAGFIEISASTPLARSIEVEVEVEVDPPQPPRKKKNRKQRELVPALNGQVKVTRPTCSACGLSLSGPNKLAEHLYLSHDGPEPAHWLEAEKKAHA